MTLLMVAFFYINYQKELQSFDKSLLSRMHLCSYSLKCKEFKIDFKEKQKQNNYMLLKSEDEILSYYPIREASDFLLKLSLSKNLYHSQMHHLHKSLILNALISLILIIFLSIFFSFYALHPLRNSLELTQEFVKDILHDFNTPISTMRLNVSLLKKECKENKKLQRIERSIENILLLQENLKNYLQAKECSKEVFVLSYLIQERVNMIEHNFPHLNYTVTISDKTTLSTCKKEFTRIIDNILSNASKYNKTGGFIDILYISKEHILIIKDNGKGIKNPKKVFNRFYKEHERGLGIGLHIVKKLCQKLGIKIYLKSKLDEGTEVFITLSTASS